MKSEEVNSMIREIVQIGHLWQWYMIDPPNDGGDHTELINRVRDHWLYNQWKREENCSLPFSDYTMDEIKKWQKDPEKMGILYELLEVNV